jgi:radical SAM superfamily enzyme YgiQ (UPF0313 family)
LADPQKYAGERFLERYPVEQSDAPLAIAAYPNRYAVGMSNLGFHFLFSSLAGSGLFRVQRSFLDSEGSGQGGDAVFFTVSYEEDLLGVVRMLTEMGIEPLRANRQGGPLVIAGGPVVSSNPLPLFPIVDILAAGEGELVLPRILKTVSGGNDKRRIADELSDIDGILLPGFSEDTILPAPVVPDDFQRSVILSPGAVFPDMLLVEISRGCPGACSFCMATSIYRPFRTISRERFETIVDSAIREVGTLEARIGLVSTAAAAHPQFTELIRTAADKGLGVGMSSLRAVDIDPGKAEAIVAAGIKSISLAPESGSEKLRRRLGKNVSDATYIKAVKLLSAGGIKRLSMYMLAGVPGENEESQAETKSFLSKLTAAAGDSRISVHLNLLVPKPQTPLQFMALPVPKDIARSVDSMREGCLSSGVGFTVKGRRSSINQAIIALGDESVGRAAVRFASGRTSWKRALKDEGFDPASIHEDRSSADLLPWEKVFGKAGREALLARYKAVID